MIFITNLTFQTLQNTVSVNDEFSDWEQNERIETKQNNCKTKLASKQTLKHCQPRFTDTGYLHTVYFHCNNYVITVNIVPCSNNDRLLQVNKMLFRTVLKNSNKVKSQIHCHACFNNNTLQNLKDFTLRL